VDGLYLCLKNVKRIIHICALGFGIVALLIAGSWAVPRYKTYAARQHWKEQAIPFRMANGTTPRVTFAFE
jgi:hypothetical protein